MNDRRYVKNGDRMDDSPMDTDSSDASNSSASEKSELRYQPEVRTQLSQKNPLLMDLLAPDSNKPLSSPRKNSVERLHRNLPSSSKDKSAPELPIPHDDSEPLLTVNPPNEMSAAINYSGMQTSPDRSESSPEIHGTFISDENGNLQEVENKQELTEEAAPPNLLLSAGDKPSTSLGAPQSCERTCSPVEPRSERYPVYAYEAQTLLQSVLKEIMQYHAENEGWKILAPQFLDDPESASKKCGSDLEKDLIDHFAAMDTDLPKKWGQNMQCTREMAIEIYALGAYEMLLSSVITALTLIKTVRLSCDFEGFILTYVSLKGLYDTFPHYWKTYNIEAIEDEASRNRLKILKEKVQRLLEVAVTAFRLFFMYIGENAEEEKMVEYEKYLSDEDKTYLRRNNLTLKTFKN